MRETKAILIRLPDELKASMEGRAALEDLSVAQLVRKVMRAYVDGQKDEK